MLIWSWRLAVAHLHEGIAAIQTALCNPTLRPHFAAIEAKRLVKSASVSTRGADVAKAASLLQQGHTLMCRQEAEKLASISAKPAHIAATKTGRRRTRWSRCCESIRMVSSPMVGILSSRMDWLHAQESLDLRFYEIVVRLGARTTAGQMSPDALNDSKLTPPQVLYFSSLSSGGKYRSVRLGMTKHLSFDSCQRLR